MLKITHVIYAVDKRKRHYTRAYQNRMSEKQKSEVQLPEQDNKPYNKHPISCSHSRVNS